MPSVAAKEISREQWELLHPVARRAANSLVESRDLRDDLSQDLMLHAPRIINRLTETFGGATFGDGVVFIAFRKLGLCILSRSKAYRKINVKRDFTASRRSRCYSVEHADSRRAVFTESVTCMHCGREFDQKNHDQWTCSRKCYRNFWSTRKRIKNFADDLIAIRELFSAREWVTDREINILLGYDRESNRASNVCMSALHLLGADVTISRLGYKLGGETLAERAIRTFSKPTFISNQNERQFEYLKLMGVRFIESDGLYFTLSEVPTIGVQLVAMRLKPLPVQCPLCQVEFVASNARLLSPSMTCSKKCASRSRFLRHGR